MLELFTTREIATFIWFILFFCLMSINKQVRKNLIRVIKIALAPQLAIPAIIIYLYGILFCIFVSQQPMWEVEYCKDVFMWDTFAGLPLCFGAVQTQNAKYFKRIITNNLKLTVLFECVFSTFTYSLIAELIIIPVVFIIGLMQAVADHKNEYKTIANVFQKLLLIIGFIMLAATCKHAIDEFKISQAPQMVASLIIPLILSILYIPLSYLLSLYANYQEAFIRMTFYEPREKSIRFHHRIKAIIACKFSIRKTRLLCQTCANYMYVSMPETAFGTYIKMIADGSIEK